MNAPNVWQLVELETLTPSPISWKYEDPVKVQKLENSLALYGQLKALVIRGTEVLHGRHLMRAMLNLGWTHAMAVTAPEGHIQLAMGLGHDVNYAQLAAHVDQTPAPVTELATISNFSSQRLQYFRELLYFDWSQFSVGEDQGALWEDEAQHATRRGETSGHTVGELPQHQKPQAPTERKVSIRPAGPQIQRPAPPPRPTMPPRPAPTIAIKPGAPSAALRGPELDSAPVVTPTSILVQFSSGPSAAEQNWTPDDPPELGDCKEIELDTETTGLKWWKGDLPIGMSIRRPDGKTWYLPWGHAGGNLDPHLVRRWAQRELRDKTITGANIKFDVHMLREWGIDLEEQNCRVSDVQHYAALLDDYRREVNLNALAAEFLKKNKSGQDLDKSRMADYHASQVAQYAKDDVTLTGELRQVMWPMLTKEDLHRVRELEEDVIYPVCECEKNAAPIDVPLLKTWVRRSEVELNNILQYIADKVGFQVNPDKSEDMQKLFEHQGVPVTLFTEHGAPSFTDALLKGIDNELIQFARRAGKIASLRSKFLVSYDRVIEDDGLLRFELHQLRGDEHGTNRGRFSSSNKNIQQVMSPTKQRVAWGYHEDDTTHDEEIYLIRRLFIAGAGMRFMSSDAMQIEYRLFAHFAASPTILAAYAADPLMSFHKFVWKMVDEFVSGLGYDKIKTLNFMLVYGGGKDKTAELLELPRAEADKFTNAYHTVFPEIKPLLHKASTLAAERGFVRTILGRRARFPDRKFTHKAFNAVDQGSAADIMKTKMVEVHRARKATGFIMRGSVHDELFGDAPDQKCADMVTAILNQQSFNLKVPILWKTALGNNWAEC